MLLLKKILACAMDIGEGMLISGAGVSRVEDTIERICKAYGAKSVEAFSITSSIVVTVTTEDGDIFTQTKRIKHEILDFNKLDHYNDLSRYICSKKPDVAYIKHKIMEIQQEPFYSLPLQSFISAVTAGIFTVFFHGGLREALISAVCGFFVCIGMEYLRRFRSNMMFSNFAIIFVVSSISVIAVHFGLAGNYGHIIIGNIMLLVPGVTFVNSIRDIIGGDIAAGTLRLCEVIVHAAFLAGGSFAALVFWGGVL